MDFCYIQVRYPSHRRGEGCPFSCSRPAPLHLITAPFNLLLPNPSVVLKQLNRHCRQFDISGYELLLINKSASAPWLVILSLFITTEDLVNWIFFLSFPCRFGLCKPWNGRAWNWISPGEDNHNWIWYVLRSNYPLLIRSKKETNLLPWIQFLSLVILDKKSALNIVLSLQQRTSNMG